MHFNIPVLLLLLLLQGAFRILNDPDSLENTMATMHLRPSKPIECVVRVYIIRVSKIFPITLFNNILIYFCSLINMITAHCICRYQRYVNYSS